MKVRTVEEIKARFTALGYKFPKGVHIVGIRNSKHVNNVFDDELICFRDNTIVVRDIATTVPGTDWLTTAMNPKGAAVLKPDQYIDSWQIGLHHGEYTALVQAKPVTVYRDNDKDETPEEIGALDKGVFGINIHHANSKLVSKIISKWSAGCSVWASPFSFDIFIRTCQDSKQELFTYTLIKEF